MPGTQLRKQDAHLALELLERYRNKLNDPGDQNLRDSITRAINAIRSRLFQALVDIQEFYVHTLGDEYKPGYQKTAETLQLANQWEGSSAPIPVASSQQENDTKATTVQKVGPVAVSILPTPSQPPPKREDSGIRDEADDDDKYEVETVVLEKGTTGLGFSIAGGMDSPHIMDSTAIYVTKIIPGGTAEKDGRLRMDDEILTVNNVSLGNVTHVQAVQALKDAGQHVTLVVRRPKGNASLPKVTSAFQPPPVEMATSVAPDVADSSTTTSSYKPNMQRISTCILTKNEKGLGFSIAGGKGTEHIPDDDGIFVTKIIPGGAAAEEGTLTIGDRIIRVNEHSMVGVTHMMAVDILRSTSSRVELHFERTGGNQVQPTGPRVFKFDGVPDQAPSRDSHVEIKPYQERVVNFERPEGTGLGFNIIGGEDNVGIFISSITPGGMADTTKLVIAGDQILEVNKGDLRNATHEEAALALKGAGTHVELLVEHRPSQFAEFQAKIDNVRDSMAQSPISPGIKTTVKKSLYVRALFDYDHTKDSGLPQPGLSFKHGDVLHVINAGDDDWWQAALVGAHAEDGPKGLIPSKKRVEKKSKAMQKNVKFTKSGEGDKAARNSFSGGKRKGSLRLSKKLPFFKMKDGSPDEEKEAADDTHVPSYEPVMLEHRGYARPVIILGPLKDDINDMLVQEFPDKFAGCVPHTTRKPREGEVDGRDYHFVESVEQMEKDIQAHLFIEAGRYKDNLYGTSIKAVQEVADQGKHCILGVSGYAIRRLQMAELYPIAICIRPSSAEVIESANTRMQVSLEQAQLMLEKGEKIEQEFAEYFTAIVEAGSLPDIYSKVKNVIHEQSGNHMWVPSSESI